MAKIEIYFPKLLQFEGGYVNDKTDMGGATNMGVTLATWKAMGYDKNGDRIINEIDIQELTKDDAMKVCKRGYWDKWKADSINNQSVAEQLVEWVWGSGKWGIILPQRLLNLKEDGEVGPITLAAVNAQDQAKFHALLIEARLSFIDQLISSHPEQIKYKNGWDRRINSFKYSD